MCGIIISPNQSKLDSIKHRGIQFSSIQKDGWFYGHHRLPIQTLEDDDWNQPIDLGYGRILLFNGEIFNYDSTKYDNDVEYLKDLFSKPKLNPKEEIYEINKWDGFWSIVIVDGDKIIAFTDPLGKKQLYYNLFTQEISSEIKELSKSNIIDPVFISTVNKWGYNTDDRTLYEDVRRIMPNMIYTFNKKYIYHNHNTINEYFKWDQNIPKDSIFNLLRESVQRRLLTKKYKVSTLFSGGLDSTIILWLLKNLGADVNIYSINNEEDGEYVKYLENWWNLKINYLDVKPEELSIEEKMKIYDINDSMIDLGSVIPQYYLFKDIKDKIVLTGDGADELFGGYRRINEYDSQKSDIFQELPFYHMIRIDRMSMNFTIECRNPFLGHDVVRAALQLPYSERTNKKILKDEFKGLIPDEIINRKKNPLKISAIRENETKYRRELIEEYLKWKKI
jgi:asparagine synthase (glutamine-hydrolysing)